MFDGKHLYRGQYADRSKVEFTVKGKYIYKGFGYDDSDIIFNYDGKFLYTGRYTNRYDIVMNTDVAIPPIVMLFIKLRPSKSLPW
jgi:hypothetical protein